MKSLEIISLFLELTPFKHFTDFTKEETSKSIWKPEPVKKLQISVLLFGLVKECEYTYYLLTVYTAALCFNGFLASYQLRFVWKISPLLDHKMCDSWLLLFSRTMEASYCHFYVTKMTNLIRKKGKPKVFKIINQVRL